MGSASSATTGFSYEEVVGLTSVPAGDNYRILLADGQPSEA